MGFSLRWSSDSRASPHVIVEEIPVYHYQTEDVFPKTLIPESASSPFISYIIESATFDARMPTVVNFTAILVVNPELLLSNGHPTLECAEGLHRGAKFTISQIDMESK